MKKQASLRFLVAFIVIINYACEKSPNDSASCELTESQCQNGSTLDPELCQCNCPFGYAGAYCQTQTEQCGYTNEWKIQYNLTASEVGLQVDNLGAQGWSLSKINAVKTGSQTQFTCFWKKNMGIGWYLYFGFTAADLQAKTNQLASQAFRMTWIEGYNEGNQIRYAAIWESGVANPVEVYWGLSRAQLQSKVSELTPYGYQMKQVDVCAINGQESFAAIWEQKNSSPDYRYWTGITSNELYNKTEEYKTEGYYPSQINGYYLNSTAYFACIWIKTSCQWTAQCDMNEGAFVNYASNSSAEGYKPIDISTYTSGNTVYYAMVWVK